MMIIDGSPFLYLRFFIYLCHPLKEHLELWLSFWLELVSGGIFVAALLSTMTLYLALAQSTTVSLFALFFTPPHPQSMAFQAFHSTYTD